MGAVAVMVRSVTELLDSPEEPTSPDSWRQLAEDTIEVFDAWTTDDGFEFVIQMRERRDALLAPEDEQPATANAHLLATLDEIDNMDGPPWQYDHISEVQSIWFDKGVSAAVEAMRAALVDGPAASVDGPPPTPSP